MGCEAVQSWSLSGLVAAFLDLAIAYLLLCASAAAYLASQFLGFFGLSLPCPCDGAFLNINTKAFCLNRLLLDFPSRKASDVQLSVKRKFPFGFDPHGRRHCGVDGGDDCSNGFLEMEGEGSCSSVSVRKDKYDVKGKEVARHRPRGRVRQRKGGGGVDRHYGHSSTKGDHRFTQGSSWPSENAEARFLEYDTKDPPTMGVRRISITEINQSSDENTPKKIHIEELQDNPLGSPNGHEKYAVRHLEQKLEEERMVRASLYVELEKERSAATSAADEAMAMILRLQEEKAFIEMEARQYQRILEEKSVYDTEEMNILKEILMKREKENLFLEKEVEAYRKAMSLGDDGPDKIDASTDKCQNERCILDPQEKEIISADNKSQLASKDSEEYKKLVPVGADGLQHIQYNNKDHKLAEKIIVTCDGTEKGDMYHDPNMKQEANDGLIDISSSCDRILDKDPRVHDVHIIRRPESEVDVKRGNLDRTSGGLPPIKPRSSTERRTNSMSGVESEMLKIDCEVRRLRERLKLVQDGRNKLSLCSESRERGNNQLELLEDITRQVQEIRQLSKPGITSRQVSLPLPTSKVLSKKRRSRSVSSEFKRSSEGMISN